VYDLGAGAGNVTRLLRERWPGARITGVDESEDMLVKARAAAPDIAWERADLDALDPREHEAFEARYDAVVDRAYPRRPDGRTLFPFRRMFIVASAGQP
jgi:trans-aconitate 2-methyltransferase